ncbi:hypothetical protein [Formosa haliotis]|uniref:hypothetical protein n=1 Tax=Formosa haliotis TaxID=1555194 RepID=UPI000826969A|nr:hypothetical protein [Formosa haliotis]
MCKSLLNRILSVIILTIATLLSSCDGSSKMHKNPKQILAEKNMLSSFSERIVYLPETYTETITDTLLSTGFKIHIKTYTDMNSNISKTEIKDSLNIKTFYRNVLADISVENEQNTVFKQTLSKSFINKNIEGASEWLKPFILKSIWLDDKHIATNSSIVLNILYAEPENQTQHKTFQLIISKTGEYQISEINSKI